MQKENKSIAENKSAAANTIETHVLIIGSGPAGYSAAIYASRAAANPVVIQGTQPGGQLTITTEVENYPGFSMIMGPELMQKMKEHAESIGTRVISDHITSIDFKNRPFVCNGQSNKIYKAHSIILATGAQAKFLGLESEEFFQGHGVSGCAVCDGFFFRGKNVAIVGGGNTAAEEAIFLTKHASHVTLIHRRDKLRADKVLQERVMSNDKISILWDTVLEDILGEREPKKKVTGIKVKNVKNDEVTEMPMDGVFIAIGHTPNTDLVKGHINMDEAGYIIAKPDSTITNIPGVFAAGDVRDKVYRQAVTSAGTGCMAALDAVKYLGEIAIL